MNDHPWIVTRTRKRKCGQGECDELTRVVLYVPCSDIAEGNEPGFAKVPLCADHLVSSVLAFTAIVNRKSAHK